jgi:CRISPR-associated protein Csm1
MSLQVFLQAQLLGTEEFLSSRVCEPYEDIDLVGRCAWLNLFCEVLPRALLAELRLSRMLLGSSSAEQFLLVLAEEDIPRANAFLARVAGAITELSRGELRLIWASTENLGAWPVARKRLDDALATEISAPLASTAERARVFSPFEENANACAESYFAEFAQQLSLASRIGWSNDRPAHLTWDEGQYSWQVKEQSDTDDDGILFPRRFALNDAGNPASPAEMAERAEGTPLWGVLKGDVDHFDAQLKRSRTTEDHIHLSVLFKEFFAGELALLCTLPDVWWKVMLLYRGGDDFALVGAWDALLMLARELQRLFEKFTEENLQSAPTLEGKTITMALAIAPDIGARISNVFEQATEQLHYAKATEAGTFNLFGRTLEWKRLSDAEELKASLMRLVRDFGYSPDYIHDLVSVYRETFAAHGGHRKAIRVDKPWRTYMRLSRAIPQSRGKEMNNLRTAVITSLIGKRTAALKLRPSARVALEWARMAAGNPL